MYSYLSKNNLWKVFVSQHKFCINLKTGLYPLLSSKTWNINRYFKLSALSGKLKLMVLNMVLVSEMLMVNFSNLVLRLVFGDESPD